jgi:hypothetical protein
MTGIRQHLSLSHTKPRMFVLPSECVLRYRSRSSVALTRARPLFNTVCPPSGGSREKPPFTTLHREKTLTSVGIRVIHAPGLLAVTLLRQSE